MNYFFIHKDGGKEELSKILSLKVKEQTLLELLECNRYYHSYTYHIEPMLKEISLSNYNEYDKTSLYFFALFHDIIIEKNSSENEEKSAEVFLSLCSHFLLDSVIRKTYEMILATKTHLISKDELVNFALKLDLSSFKKPLIEILEGEKLIRKEYSYVDWDLYKNERIKILEKFKENEIIKLFGEETIYKIYLQIEYLKTLVPNIAVYPGAFNPFHKGHENILKKAEKIFDKVIIARGINTDKSESSYSLSELEKRNYQIDTYTGLLTDYLNSKNYPLTVIRGLRNGTDLQYELNQYRWLQELDSEVKVISIFCDKEYEHVSSSAIRTLSKFNKKTSYEI